MYILVFIGFSDLFAAQKRICVFGLRGIGLSVLYRLCCFEGALHIYCTLSRKAAKKVHGQTNIQKDKRGKEKEAS